ncbi:hypothetical protein B9Z55_016100 [Caenorhabditis nigoni]|uniref:Uncharacterized protein n=1 Tax=Caenorhabditis nigoni TaxID=1611254 RepID=A0A2G5UD92_9PELO|nr:hypothetical protein B9Z55_016100 [Caenorhabditis nigoni]
MEENGLFWVAPGGIGAPPTEVMVEAPRGAPPTAVIVDEPEAGAPPTAVMVEDPPIGAPPTAVIVDAPRGAPPTAVIVEAPPPEAAAGKSIFDILKNRVGDQYEASAMMGAEYLALATNFQASAINILCRREIKNVGDSSAIIMKRRQSIFSIGDQFFALAIDL